MSSNKSIELEDIRKKIAENWDEQMETLRELIAIKSVAEDLEEGDAPFGGGVDKAFHYMLDKGSDFGFDPVDVDGYGGHIQFGEEGEIMGIAVHLDCVPEGDGWTHDPFGCEIADGKIYGRGTNDDKGPAVASLYAMKALVDLGFEPVNRVRLILGLDEETNWIGMKYYLENEEMPAFGFTPDGDFPVINGEKGILVFDLAKKFARANAPGLELRSIKGGEAENMVPSHARAIVMSDKKSDYDEIKERARYFEELKKVKTQTRVIGKSFEITVEGVPAHGAHPELGRNAISLMMEFLGMLEFAGDDVTDFINFYNQHIAHETNGESLGCLLKDELSGDTILNVGLADVDTKSGRVTVNVRYPISCRDEDIYAGMDAACSRFNVGVVKKANKPPLYVDAGSDYIRTLMDCYRQCTGDEESEPLIIGGGTYARLFDNFVAFGAKFPGGADVEHQKDEYITVEDFKKMTEIYAMAILKCAAQDAGVTENTDAA